MTGSIFLIGSGNELTELTRSSYDSEDLLQRLLADHPAVLGSAFGANGDLLLIDREYSVPDAQYGSGRWSLDHLFLDRDGVPVLVEVKRASDTRARREVVAQMLDYAANGVAYWPIDEIIAAYRATASRGGVDPDSTLDQFLGGADPGTFWKTVEANLRSGRVRMVFLADEIGKELRKIVEFLNEQMRPAEVLAVEVVQYLNPNGIRTLVPTLVGSTERARAAKSIGQAKASISEAEWLQTLEQEHGSEARTTAEQVIGWFEDLGLEHGVSRSHDSLYATGRLANGKSVYPFFIRRRTGNVEVSLQNLANAPAYQPDGARLLLLQKIKAAFPEAAITTTKATSWPALPLRLLYQPRVQSALVDLMTGVVDAVRSPN